MADKQPYQLTPRTLAITDVIPTQDAAGALDVGSNTLQDVASLVGQTLTVKKTLTSGQILALNTTPIALIAAPGAGFMIQVLGIMAKLRYNTTPYATNSTIQVQYNGLSGQMMFNSSLLTQSATASARFAISTNALSTSPLIENTALMISVQTGNPTAGDSQVDFYITYVTIAL